MNIKQLSTQLSRATLLVVLGLLLSAARPTLAQQQLQAEELQVQRVLNPPAFGTFFLLQDKHSPPYPFDPSFGQLPVYEWKPGVYLVDDAGVDYAALKSSGGLGGAMSLMSMPAPCDPCPTNSLTGDPVSFAPAYSYAPTNLWLEITKVTNDQAFFVIHTPDTFGGYDLFGSTNMNLTTNVGGLNRTNWVWLTRSATGQTNLVLTNLWPSEGWFQLGSMLDSDSDGLPDAFEIFTSKTNPNLRDSNANGIDDGDEVGPNGLPWRLEQERRNAVVVYATTPTATEGGACGQFTVYLPAPAPTGGATIKYRFGGSAILNTDFTTTPSSNTLTISAGASSGVVTVCAVNNTGFQDFDRYAEITLTNASCCAVDSQPARVTLVDNDLPGVRVFAFPQWVRKPSPTFGTNAAGFFFVRDGDSTSSATLNFAVTGSAVSGTDYTTLSSFSINFPANVRTNYLPLTLKPTTNTTDRTCTLTISSISGYQIDPAAGAATIIIASSTISLPTVQVTATDDDAREAGLMPGTFTFTRTGSTAAPLRVAYRVSGTATAGSTNSGRDYVALPETVVFAAGKSSTNVTVNPLDDDISETVETVIVTLSAGDYQIGTNNTATVYIDDNEPIDFIAEPVREGIKGSTFRQASEFRITRHGTALSSATMNWSMTYTYTPNILSSVTPSGVSGSQVVWAPRQSVAIIQFTTFWTVYTDETKGASLSLNNAYLNTSLPVLYHPQSHYVTITSSGSPATTLAEGATTTGGLIFRRPYPNTNSFSLTYSTEGSAVHGAGNDYSVNSTYPEVVVFGPNVSQVNVNVQAYTNPQTNGWKTGIIMLDNNSLQVADASLDHAFVRIQDVQVSNPVLDTDFDGDGLSDGWELDHLSSNDPLTPDDPHRDTDRDGLGAVEEMQLGTSPTVADAQPVYPSEDPDDYVPLTLHLGAVGKLAGKVGCAACHEVGLRAGSHLRYGPRTSWENVSEVDYVIRFLRGTNYPVTLFDDPYSQVLRSSETNQTPLWYSAAYTAQFLAGPPGAVYPLITDTNLLFGSNKPVVLEALAKSAVLYVPDMIIAADVDRDGIVNASSRADRTSTNSPLTFWINDDLDIGSDDTAYDGDPSTNAVNSANTVIDGLRDLEDFTRLHFRVEGLPGNLLTNAGIQTRLYLTNLVGTPSLRLFRATETNGALGYLTNTTVAAAQTNMGTLGLLANGTALTLASTNWKSAGTNRFFLPTIFEGVSTGRCVIAFVITGTNGSNVAVSRPFYLDLRRATDLYEHWTVGDSTTNEWYQITNAARTADSAVFDMPQRDEEADYILFVHGWRMPPWERRAFASTGFKRLWHLGYKGRYGLFSWPTDHTDLDFWDLTKTNTLQNYDRSEQRAWKAGTPLNRLLLDLNGFYPNRLRVMAHSMGNIVASEGLRLRNPSKPPFVHSYIASQAASVAHAYDAVHPETVRNDFTPFMSTPEMYAAFPRGNVTNAFFTGMKNAVATDPLTLARRTINFHNGVDFALNSVKAWPANQITKPDIGWHSLLPTTTKQYSFWRGATTRLYLSATNLDQTYEIYSHIAEARSKALGCSEDPGHQVRGEIGSAVDLHAGTFNYQDNDYEHSAQFRSINPNRRLYWWQVLGTFSLTNGLPQP